MSRKVPLGVARSQGEAKGGLIAIPYAPVAEGFRESAQNLAQVGTNQPSSRHK